MASAGWPEPCAHSSQALQSGASARASRQRLSQVERLVPAAGLDGQPGLAEPDPDVLRGQLAGLLQGPLQALVRQPTQVEIAELPEVAGRILRLRQAGVVQGLDVVESDLDLIEMAQQLARLVAAGAAPSQGPLEAPLGVVEPPSRQVGLRLEVGAQGLEGISFGHPGEGAERGVGAAAQRLADPQPVIGRPVQCTRARRQTGQPSMRRVQPAGRDVLLCELQLAPGPPGIEPDEQGPGQGEEPGADPDPPPAPPLCIIESPWVPLSSRSTITTPVKPAAAQPGKPPLCGLRSARYAGARLRGRFTPRASPDCLARSPRVRIAQHRRSCRDRRSGPPSGTSRGPISALIARPVTLA